MNKIKTLAIFTIIIFFFNLNKVYASDVFIEFKIENEVITNIDINKEKNYLIALNNNLKNISKKQLYEISKKSVINETIKKKEILNYFDLEKAELVMDVIIADFYKQLGFKNKEEFKNYLQNYQVSINFVREKLKIEALWNELIFNKFKSQISIDENKIKSKIKQNLVENKIEELNLSEIIYDLKQGEQIEEKYKKILNIIKKSGFANTANLYSISESAKFGGKIGWIKKNQLSKNILNNLQNLSSEKISKPIAVNNGYLIIKINEKRLIEKKININNELKYAIQQEKNRQLNQFSLIYFNKIKKNVLLSD